MNKDDVICGLHNLLHVVDQLPDNADVISAGVDIFPNKLYVFLHKGFELFAEERHLICERVPYGERDKIRVMISGVDVFKLVDKEVDAHDGALDL